MKGWYIVYHRYGQSTILAASFEEAWRIAREKYEGVYQVVLQNTGGEREN